MKSPLWIMMVAALATATVPLIARGDDATTQPANAQVAPSQEPPDQSPDQSPAPDLDSAAKPSRSHVVAPFNLLPDLTDDQKLKIRDIHEQCLEQERLLKEKEHDEIEATLTDAQKKELDDLVARQDAQKKLQAAQRRAKSEEEKAAALQQEAQGGAATQPSDAP